MKSLLLRIIRLYQLTLSPYWPAACRYTPSCSSYAYDTVQRFGVGKGGSLTLRRLARCRPLGGSGYDPVPGSDAPPAQPYRFSQKGSAEGHNPSAGGTGVSPDFFLHPLPGQEGGRGIVE